MCPGSLTWSGRWIWRRIFFRRMVGGIRRFEAADRIWRINATNGFYESRQPRRRETSKNRPTLKRPLFHEKPGMLFCMVMVS